MLQAHPDEKSTARSRNEYAPFDVVVIGGGINGVGIANDAAGRGLSVLLCEQHDLAAHTSSASSKLIHGGLRYLEHFEFRLVHEALGEREVLLRKAPHIIWPLRFVLPHQSHLRPRWMLRAGLFFYDHLGARTTLPGSTSLRLDTQGPLQPRFTHAFEYSDCWADDARLVALNAVQARSLGAEIRTRTRCVSAKREAGLWNLELETVHGDREWVQGRALVNASGPWAAQVIEQVVSARSPHAIRLVQGSHIVVPQLYRGSQAYILQNEDQRIVFVIPYEHQFSLVGTTDLDYRGDPAESSPTEGEERYLLDVVNAHFRRQLGAQDIHHRYAGVRPLLDDEDDNPSAVTRDYTLTVDAPDDGPPLLSVFGGKLTTYRRLAEAALEKLEPWLAAGPAWTAAHALPGGDFETQETLAAKLASRFPWLSPEQTTRYVRSYGTLSRMFLHGAGSAQDLGEDFGGGLTEREVEYLCEREWAIEAEDILWRRSKLGLHLSTAQQQRLKEYLQARQAR